MPIACVLDDYFKIVAGIFPLRTQAVSGLVPILARAPVAA